MILIEHATVITLGQERLRLMYLAATIHKDARLDVSVMPPERVPDERALYERAEALARQQIARAGLTVQSKWPIVS